VLHVEAQQDRRRVDRLVEPLLRCAREAEHLLVEADVTRVDLDQRVGAAMHFEHVHAGDVEDGAEQRLRSHRLVDRELGELAQLAARLAQRMDAVGVQGFDIEALGAVERRGDRRHGRALVGGGQGDASTPPRLERRDRIAAPGIAALEQRAGPMELGGVSDCKNFEAVIGLVADFHEFLGNALAAIGIGRKGRDGGRVETGVESGKRRLDLNGQNFSSMPPIVGSLLRLLSVHVPLAFRRRSGFGAGSARRPSDPSSPVRHSPMTSLSDTPREA
jgi:hypothetical protein